MQKHFLLHRQMYYITFQSDMQPELSGEFEDWSFHHGKIQSRYHRRYGYGRPAVRPADGESPLVHARRSCSQRTQRRQALPGEAFEKETHCVDLTESTIKANARIFASMDEVPKQAYTMGIKNIMAAKNLAFALIVLSVRSTQCVSFSKASPRFDFCRMVMCFIFKH